MYAVDARDMVVELHDLPQSSIGAPCPIVLSDEYAVVLAYLIDRGHPEWDGTNPRVVGPDTPGETVALVRFDRSLALMFGPPNDEAFSGHPLASRGLRPYMVAEIRESSWIRSLERMNAVHPCHRSEAFANYRHFVFAFHDSTVECIARGLEVSVRESPMMALMPEMVRLLGRAD